MPPRNKIGTKVRAAAWKLAVAKDYILAHPSAGLAQVVKATGVSQGTVTKARQALIAEGRAPRSLYDHVSPENRPALPDEQPADPVAAARVWKGDLAALVQEVAGGTGNAAPLTVDERKLLLSGLARSSESAQVTIAAIQGLNRLEAQTGERNKLGPPPPLTREDKLERLALLMEACGPALVADAAKIAFPAKDPDEAPADEAIAVEDADAGSQAPTDEGGAVGPQDDGRQGALEDQSPRAEEHSDPGGHG